MPRSPRVRVYLGCSLDGFIAGPDNDLSWLHEAPAETEEAEPAPKSEALGFEDFLGQVGAMLMGRRTYEVIASMLKLDERPEQWPYGELPVLVVTHRPLSSPIPTVRPVAGEIEALVAEAKALAGDKDVYLDGGDLVRQGLEAGLVDEMVLTFVPILLAGGVRLFDGLVTRRALELTHHARYGRGMVQVTAKVLQSPR